MTRVHQAASLIIIAFCSWVGFTSVKMTYYTSIGPGPGFFPFWLALIMGVLSAVWFLQLWLRPLPGSAADFLPGKAGSIRVAALVISALLFGLALEKVGFSLSMFAFLLFLLIALGRQSLTVTLSVSLIGSFGVYYLFSHYLKVPLPASSVGFISGLGF
jgi:putative tricarboxylic transport membrane protein